MKRKIIFCCFLLAYITSYAQFASVVTDKANEAMGKYKAFILVDRATQYVLAQDPIKYNPEAVMPSCYFSSLAPTETGLTSGDRYRYMAINALPVVDGQHWVICENKETNKTMFSRRKFLSDLRAQYLWIPIVEGDYVMFLNLKGATNTNWGGYLSIDEEGHFSSVKNTSEASKWKLIYVQ